MQDLEILSKNSKNIFRAINEGKWLEIKYRPENPTKPEKEFWIGVNDINTNNNTINVVGMSLNGNHPITDFPLYIENILDSKVIQNTYNPKNQKLLDDIKNHPKKYSNIFRNTRNLKILDYLSECLKYDSDACEDKKFIMLKSVDDEILNSTGTYKLDNEQFNLIVKTFQEEIKNSQNLKNNQKEFFELCLNVLSIYSSKGLYVLAYRPVRLDVRNKTLITDEEICVNKKFDRARIERYIYEDELYLVDDFKTNAEKIKNVITQNLIYKNLQKECFVDDTPKFICIKRTTMIKLEDEYNTILEMYETNNVSEPIKAFFGEINAEKINEETNPIVLLNDKVNLDQLLALYNATNQNVSYVQGPPGTGKTNTILNVISTCFFNNMPVLFSSYNNHPLDTVIENLSNIKYKHRKYYENKNGKYYEDVEDNIPFPIIKIANNNNMSAELDRVYKLYEKSLSEEVFEKSLSWKKNQKIERTKKLIEILQKHKKFLELREQQEAVEAMLEKASGNLTMLDFESRLKNQLEEQRKSIGEVTDEEALKTLDNDYKEFMKYLYYTSVGYLQKIDNLENRDFKNILKNQNKTEQVEQFNAFLKIPENVRKLQKIFPIMVSTCLSSAKIGIPQQYFDITIIDEASQCNMAVSLVPILRGKRLMLVGDTNQLSPVITLDKSVNEELRKKYKVNESYDYIENSIYKTFLKNDPKSEETLLRNHYRCDKKIIGFCNKKYYCDKLNIKSEGNSKKPIMFRQVNESFDDVNTMRNTSLAEVEEIKQIIAQNKDKSIGIITPFANQRELLKKEFLENDFPNIHIGTVHQFQGDEKDIIIFSPAITKKSWKGSFNWLNHNRELINVAMSRSKNEFIFVGDQKAIESLYNETKSLEEQKIDSTSDGNDFYDLYSYVKTNGNYEPTKNKATSRALGLKPFSSETENVFLETLNQAISCIIEKEDANKKNKYSIKPQIQISNIFEYLPPNDNELFYTGRFDFVLFKKVNRQEIPLLAIELDGPEHQNDEKTIERDNKKKEICKNHKFTLIHVDNSYARRYCYIKEILREYFVAET